MGIPEDGTYVKHAEAAFGAEERPPEQDLQEGVFLKSTPTDGVAHPRANVRPMMAAALMNARADPNDVPLMVRMDVFLCKRDTNDFNTSCNQAFNVVHLAFVMPFVPFLVLVAKAA